MKKIILFISMILYSALSLHAQEPKTTQELLMSTKWEPLNTFDEGDKGYISFTKDYTFEAWEIDYEIEHNSAKYYLSSTIDKTFDKNKVGKYSEGKYIIEDGGEYLCIWEIEELTPTKLVTRNLMSYSSAYGHTIVYRPTDMDF